MTYSEDDYLQLGGIQHFSFCRRQWALMTIEVAWADNWRTVDGSVMHERAHDESRHEKRGDVFIVSGLRISSPTLGLSGQCDVVEFHADPEGVPLIGKKGMWSPYPIEYKRGKQKADDCDRLQLCAQAMCLEEMLACHVSEGALFYGESHRREAVEFTEGLRDKVSSIAKEMHDMFARRHIPKVKTGTWCKQCSLVDVCMPVLNKARSAKKYLEERTCEN